MRKTKGASTSKGSNLPVHQNTRAEGSKGVRSKKGRGSQTNKRQTPAQRERVKSPSQKHPEPSPNLSCIFRNPDSQEDDEYYGNPLHSTAVFDNESELNNEGNDKEAECPARSNNQGNPTQQPMPLIEKIRTEKRALTRISEGVEAQQNEVNTGSASNEALSENANEPIQKTETKRVKLKTVSSSQPSKASKRSKDTRSRTGAVKNPSDGKSGIKQTAASAGATKKLLVETRASISKWKKQSNMRADASAAHSRDSPFHAEPSTETSLQSNVKTYGQKRKKALVRRATGSDASPNSSESRPPTPEAGPSSAKVSRPEGVKRLTKNVTELNVVLNEFEEIVTEYKPSVESDVCRKVIDRFFTDLKEEVTETIRQVQELKNLERENAKVITTFNKTRKHFLVAQKELTEQEAQLKHLHKEYSELSQKKSDLLLATQLVSGFKQLQTQYIEHRSKNPGEKQTYNISSFPALLVEARGILGAEKQLQIINTKLQQSLDKK
ncbi:centromere protein U [Carcharodon carcharias]|uniref:centromere protein U n=1 Tax=Carcharodon carcharias TaxID=13397 RepID=UPI001B7DC810|nr:centromere protein U [Carcharodon carcharias]XP_041041756.1 centromere protein U [Carcharodon carcharias]XP_041041757.1 centromere protein U [Carcharodon carcharias]XP_041041758.1 centromere protein U [Carcharodon carcharias]